MSALNILFVAFMCNFFAKQQCQILFLLGITIPPAYFFLSVCFFYVLLINYLINPRKQNFHCSLSLFQQRLRVHQEQGGNESQQMQIHRHPAVV